MRVETGGRDFALRWHRERSWSWGARPQRSRSGQAVLRLRSRRATTRAADLAPTPSPRPRTREPVAREPRRRYTRLHAFAGRRGPARARGRAARRVAAVRLPGLEPDRRAAVRPGRRQEDDDPALVLPDSGDRRAAGPGARDRAPQPRRPARRQAALCGPGSARSRAARPAQGHEARGDGVFARQQHSLHLAGRRRDDRIGARSRRRGRVLGRPGPAVRGAVVRRRARQSPGRVGGALPRSRTRPSRWSASGSPPASR